MAAMLVDYENVCSANGLNGVGYLEPHDSLYIFFSQCCRRIRAEYINSIKDSGCLFRIIRLQAPRKNALDFYIAAQAGILSQEGEKQIAIISNDKGLVSVSDFFQANDNGTYVVVAPDIEHALLSLNAPDDESRRAMLHEKTEMLDLASEHARIEERNIIKKKITDSFTGTEYESLLPRIYEYVDNNLKMEPKKFYVGALHTFGRSNGTRIYSVLKCLLTQKEEEKKTQDKK